MNLISNKLDFSDNISLSGLTKELTVFYVAEKFNRSTENILVVANSLFEASQYYKFLQTYTDNVYFFPMDDFLTSVAIAVSPELKSKRLETLKNIADKNKSIVVTNLTGYLKYLSNVKSLDKMHFNLEKKSKIDRDKLLELLDKFGYRKESIVTSTGEYSVRGYIIDIFIVENEHPVRIEFFGNEIESIRYFNEEDQKSINEISKIEIFPFEEIETEQKSSLLEYMNSPVVVYINYNQIKLGYEKMCEEILEYNHSNNFKQKYMFDLNDLNPSKEVYLNTFLDTFNGIKNISYNSQSIINYNLNLEKLKLDVIDYIKTKHTVLFCLSKDSEIKSIKNLFEDSSIVNENEIINNKVNIVKKKINQGFIIDNIIVISEFDIENVNVSKNAFSNPYKFGRKIKGFSDIHIGDYIVHSIHGIGIYNGVITLTKNGMEKDYLQINYLGNDKVYIPVEKIDSIYKYSNKEGVTPKLNKLGTTTWEKTKIAIRKKIKDISQELLKIYSLREKIKNLPFKDFEEEEIFASSFIYTETDDQLKAVEEIFKDLKSNKPMDRLLCGDVGFGKTEVAFRAVYKAVLNGYQVAYLCPTTVLSKQQYKNALTRFSEFGVNIGLFNRFTTQKEKKTLLEGLKTGKIDFVLGTHRLLSKEIEFNNLGLLIIDEEQRFGVSHKEKIKEIKSDVNVLTLSATPIPRTLKMSLSGLRDLSLIETVPINRYPIQTYVVSENDLLIKDAIYKELSRNGQIFILYNQVASIKEQLAKIKRLVPEARICIAHGQLTKTELENVMEKFVNNEYDILLCTTIIETGIDIPNVNTLIVYDSDRFGLSQLYQLRGRVGRSDKIAYAYLLYNKNKLLNEVAVKRLEAIKEFTELGSGYRIAARDLAIRGAGDLLGSEQAGFVSSVGLDLYMKMVADELRKLNGTYIESEEDSDDTSLINVETHIDDAYVSDQEIKIEIHKKINSIDSYDKLLEVKLELEDRFGYLDESILIYMYEEWFEKLAKLMNIKRVIQTDREIAIELPEDITERIEKDKLFVLAYKINQKFSFKYINKKIQISLNIYNLEKHFIYYIVDLLKQIKDIL